MARAKAIRYGGGTKRISGFGERPALIQVAQLKDPADVPGLINGRQAGSSYEWNMARALWTLKWEFDYQVSLRGGHGRRGGVVLDFLVSTRPMRTVVNPIGEYWHRNLSADALEDIMIVKILGRGTRMLRPGTGDSSTYEAALAYLSAEIGRG